MNDSFELALFLSGISEETDNTEEEVEYHLIERYGIDLDAFDQLARCLVKIIDVGESPLTGKKYKGFGTGTMWLMKTEI